MTEEEMQKRRLEITDEIQVAGAQARAEAIRVRRKDGWWWLVMVFTAVTSMGVSVFFSWHNTNETELKFCKLMNASVENAQARVRSFDEVPPTTEAGRSQQQQAREGVLLLIDLRRSLGCTIS